MVKRILMAAAVLLAGAAYAQPTPLRIPPKYTVATAPACVDGEPKLFAVTDGSSSTDCTVGGGSTEVICKCTDGTAAAVGSGGGGSSNSFETINAPAGTDPVADSATDTLNITCAGGLTCTGTAATDTLDITMGTAATATALAADPSDCAANTFAQSIAASGNLTCAAISDADVPDGITVTLAGTATALAANGANCSAGQYPLGVDASGAAESCTADDDLPDADEVTEAMLKAVNTPTDEYLLTYESTTGDFEWAQHAPTATALAANGANCSAGQYPLGVDASGAVESCTADDDLPDADEVTESMLKAVDTAIDEECLTYETTTGDFEWQTCGSAGIGGSTGATDDAILIADGTGGSTLAASAATLTSAGSLTIPSAEQLKWSTDTGLERYSAAIVGVTNGSTGVGGLLVAGSGVGISFGGTTSSYQALGVYDGRLQSQLADGSGYAGFRAENFQLSSNSGPVIQTSSDNTYISNRNTTAFATLRADVLVTASTAGSGTPKALAWYEMGNSVWTNEGTTVKSYFTLPTAIAGNRGTFVVQDTDGLRITANTGDDIRIGATTSTTAGYCESTTVGDSVTLVAINATNWFAVSLIGSGWTCAILFPAFGVRRRLRELIAANDNL